MRLTLWRIRGSLLTSVRASNQDHRGPQHVFVSLEHDGIVGWGEVSALPETILDDPSGDQVWRELVDTVGPRFRELVERESSLPEWSRVARMAASRASSIWAFAALEMAVLDHDLRSRGEDLATFWEVDVARVDEMATTSLISPDRSWQPPATAKRVRAKVDPSVDLSAVAEWMASWRRPVLLDYNASAIDVTQVVEQWSAVADRLEWSALEQPFAPGDLTRHAELALAVPIRVSMDEGVRSVLDVRRVARYGAASLVCVKPPRVGGLANARALLSEAASLGLSTYVGGFFESPLARHAHRCVAASFDVEASDVGLVQYRDAVGAPLEGGLGWIPSSGSALEYATRVEI